MAWKASKAKMVDNKKLMTVTYVTLLAFQVYMCFVFLLNSHFEVSNFVRFCANMPGTDELWWVKILTFLLFVACNLTTFVFDVAMIRFIRNRTKVNPTQLVPWKSSNPQSDEQNKSGIPVRATILSTVSFAVLSYFGLPTLSTLHYEREQVSWYRLVSMMLWLSLELPMLLIFTIKQRKGPNAVADLQPPKKLHFHDESEVNDDEPDPEVTAKMESSVGSDKNQIFLNKTSARFLNIKD